MILHCGLRGISMTLLTHVIRHKVLLWFLLSPYCCTSKCYIFLYIQNVCLAYMPPFCSTFSSSKGSPLSWSVLTFLMRPFGQLEMSTVKLAQLVWYSSPISQLTEFNQTVFVPSSCDFLCQNHCQIIIFLCLHFLLNPA